jgi:GNAT superfamily N-acetyltransferase
MVQLRAYAGDADLLAMQHLVQSIWSLNSRFHVGDLAWQRSQSIDEEWPTLLLEEGSELVAWGWAHQPGHLYLAVRPGRPDLAQTVIEWFERTARSDRLNVDALDKETHLISALQARNYRLAGDAPFDLHTILDLGMLPPKLQMPMGFRLTSMAESPGIVRRVASHHAAWHPSRMTVERYRRVMAAWPYRPDLDWMIEIADGRFVANCCVWFDEVNAVGLLEPVGVDPGFRRLGLARAVILEALRALRDLGASRAVVYPRGDAGYPFTKPLYLGLGFEPYARTLSFQKSG